MSDSIDKRQVLGAALYEEWELLEQADEQTAFVTRFKPGNDTWLQLITSFNLPSTSLFHVGVVVTPGSTWSKEYEYFTLELVRVVRNLDYPELIPPTRSRARMFYYSELITDSRLRRISPLIPDRPCIEQMRIDDQVTIDVRGVQNIEFGKWHEEIASLLKGAWLITRDNNLLTAAELRYEAEISATIEAMAQINHERSHPPRFTKTVFHRCWPFKMSWANLYNIIPEHRWLGIEQRYYSRWNQLHKK